MKLTKLTTYILFSSLFLLLNVNIVFAVCNVSGYTTKKSCEDASGIWAEPSGSSSGGTVTITDPINAGSPQLLIGRIISAVLGISGSLALLMFIYGGFTWMLSGGNSEKVAKGKNTLTWAAIGLVVIFSSYAIVRTIFTGLGGG